jgi:uncharacterized protein DUF3592
MAVNAFHAQIFLYLLAVVMFGVGVFLILRHWRLISTWMRVRGLTLKPLVDESDGIVFTTVAEYEVAGRRYVIEGRAISNCSWCHRPGRQVWVYFQPDQPAKGKLVGWWEGWLFLVPIVLAIYVATIAFIGKP